jgi:hypothetical protein
VTGTLPVANGGTGATTQTAYAVLCGGTTSTGAFQSIASVGTSGQILTSNGAGALPTFQTAAGGGGLGGTTVYTSNATFTIPTGKTVVKVTVQGGGGTGGRGGISTGIVNGGGGGGMAVKYLTGLTPGNTLTVTVGAGGTAISAGSSVSAGNSGGTSSVASGTQSITTVSATGGAGATLGSSAENAYAIPGVGGTGTNGDYNISGAKGYLESSIGWGEGGDTLKQAFGGASPFTGITNISATQLNASPASVAGVQGQGGSAPVYNGAIAAGGTGIVVFEY